MVSIVELPVVFVKLFVRKIRAFFAIVLFVKGGSTEACNRALVLVIFENVVLVTDAAHSINVKRTSCVKACSIMLQT